jgi:hypothetical protein
VRHKLLCLLFALNAGELEADFVRLKNAPYLGDKPGATAAPALVLVPQPWQSATASPTPDNQMRTSAHVFL